MRLLLTAMLIGGALTTMNAQDDPEYRMEIGVGAGAAGYLGDFNGRLTRNLQPMATAVARYVINPYMAVRMNVSYATMKGKAADADTYYPDYAQNTYSFEHTLYDVGATYEYNFWPYGTGRDYRGAKRLTPFVFAGLGATYVKTPGKARLAANMPLGLGVKYKMSERMNLGLEWAMHFAQTDYIDGVKDPYYVASSGLFKNTDCYSALQLTITYSFAPKCVTCNKE